EVLDVQLGNVVAIVGGGPIGCWQALMARDRGAACVFLIEASVDRLKLALSAVGAFVDDGWVAGEDNGVEEVLSRTAGRGADRVSVAAPAKQAQQAALEMAAQRARAVDFAVWAEQDPAAWIEALASTIQRVVDGLPGGPDAVAAISFGSQLDGMVVCDRRGRPLRPAMIWMDRRAEQQAAWMAERIGPEEFYGLV